jgi:hypothetical protein
MGATTKLLLQMYREWGAIGIENVPEFMTGWA